MKVSNKNNNNLNNMRAPIRGVGSNPPSNCPPPNIPGNHDVVKLENERMFYLRLTPKTAQDSSEVFTISVSAKDLNDFLQTSSKAYEIKII